MCALCGILGGRSHWTDSAASPDVFAQRDERHTNGRERQHRTRILNQILASRGVTVSDWSGNQYVVKSATGRSQLVSNLSELWPAVDALLPTPIDPLDATFLSSLDGATGKQ